MKPILFDSSATEYTNNGLGWLSDCVSCLVTEERNGIYEAEFDYPITGVHYDLITEGRIIAVSHDEQKDLQPFVIYRISKPISGIVTVNARHISYRLNNIIVSPFTAPNVTGAFQKFTTYAMTANPFTFWTDKVSSGDFQIDTPKPIRAALGGSQGSILDVFGGGEYEFDKFTVKLHQHRGSNNGVTIRYGKNLTDIKQDSDYSDIYNAVVPYWSDGLETVVYGGVVYGSGGITEQESWTDENGAVIQDENGSELMFQSVITQVYTMDLSTEFEQAPTVAQLEAKAQTILNNNEPWIPKVNIEVDFVALWQTEEYESIAPLERVKLCDTVTVEYADLGVQATAKVIKVVWNALVERYDRIELGDAKSTFADTLMSEADQLIAQKLEDVPTLSDMDIAIAHATSLITGGMGGHIVFLYDANGKPTDMLVMDTADVSTAVHVLRINVNGIGFSSNGINGPYTSAWTLDGQFVADFITAGTMSAARIHGGTLVLGGANNGNGSIIVYDGSGNVIGQWTNSGIEINQGTFRTYDGRRTTAIEAGYSKYYRGTTASGTYIGNIGADDQLYSDWGLSMTVMYDGESIGWYASTNAANTTYEPIFMYYKGTWFDTNNEGVEDAVSVNRNMHIAYGYSLWNSTLDECTLEDPKWKINNTAYTGYTGQINIAGSGGLQDVTLEFKRGVLTYAGYS